jgi:cytochrome c oxidase subunit 4
MKGYVLVWFLLLLLLGITVSASYIHFGVFNAAIALGIAVTKAVLIGAYFMHLRTSPRLIWLVATVGFVWLSIMFGLTAADYMTRKALPAPVVWSDH